ncbi:MAG: LysR family transcriptional regulator, low CO2-responsive transcriptional regulator [Solirubrobacteraceae bacterium]|nr:LysR family transcriptional regulator, low CO2-responsive transcriptional regulator [Solirubrobacteraceae bacterium]
MAVTLSLLRTFVTVVRTGSVTRASQELVVTQSSVSGALAALSKEMGERLVERDGRGLRPTAAGAAFLPHAERMLATLEDGTAAVREAADPTRRRLRLAATTTAGEFLVPGLWNAFRQRHPEVELTLEVGNRAGVIRALDRHQADLGIGGRPLDPRLRGVRFLENEFVLITAPEDPRVRREPLAVEDLAAGTWLVREAGSGTGEVSTEFFAARGLTRPRTLTIGSNGAIRRCVALGLGVALQPLCAVERELEEGSLARLQVAGGTPARDWYVLGAVDAPRRAAAELFLAFVERGDAARALAADGPPPLAPALAAPGGP